ncbi:hypothetical protein M9H77_30321 [Catharanthus roseus]|uniref:Uncharacterized protein n=1 Tax=Catharanthus roseus TaxID=4058 RepID=A0ACB9ZXS7_CATRO|nr:hypothetical protein M9H77_30321 [Catharanthus roseus]
MELRMHFPSLTEGDIETRISEGFSMWFREERFTGGIVFEMKMKKRPNESAMMKKKRKSFNRSPIPKRRMLSWGGPQTLKNLLHLCVFVLLLCLIISRKATICSLLSFLNAAIYFLNLHCFNKQSACAKLILKIMKHYFVEAYPIFRNVLDNMKNMWYTEFEKCFDGTRDMRVTYGQLERNGRPLISRT